MFSGTETQVCGDMMSVILETSTQMVEKWETKTAQMNNTDHSTLKSANVADEPKQI